MNGKNYVDLWVSMLYQGKKDIAPQTIEGMVISQKIIKGETLLTVNVSNGVYRSVYVERALTVYVESFATPVESEQDEYALAVEKFENMAEYTPFNDND